jgi:regulator of RNase E activity RraA
MKVAGRVFTMSFMPNRADLDAVVLAKAKDIGVQSLNNQYVFDQLQPGDVLVVDLYGKKEGGNVTVMPGDLAVGDKAGVSLVILAQNGGRRDPHPRRMDAQEIRRRQIQVERDLQQSARSRAAPGISGLSQEAAGGN